MANKTNMATGEWNQICTLSALKLGKDESEKLAGSLDRVLEHFKSLQKIDTDGVSPESRTPVDSSSLRADKPALSLERGAVLANAPHTGGEFIRVPPVLPSK